MLVLGTKNSRKNDLLTFKNKTELKTVFWTHFLEERFGVRFFPGDCQSQCKPQCSFTKYNFEKTWTKFPSPAFNRNSRALINGGGKESNVSWDYMRGNYGELVIYFGSLTVEQTDVYAKYEIFSASSAMGGLLGLFLGGSMMTIYEVVELLMIVVKDETLRFIKCAAIVSRRQTRKVQPV